MVAGGSAHAEDDLRAVRIGDVELGWTTLAIRCAVTLVDPARGRRAGPEPLRTLARYRRNAAGSGVVLGTTFAVLRAGRITVGDTIRTGAAAPATAGSAAPPPAAPAAVG